MTDQVAVLPRDQHNLELIANVHPLAWTNPKPASRYNLVVVGAGTAGLVAAAAAAGLGAKVALVEKHLLGGDCLNVGCVPSKALLRAARACASLRDASEFGVRVRGDIEVDFGAVMERVRRVRASLSPHDSAARFTKLGVNVFFGAARFVAPDRLAVDGHELRFARALIATGARASAPPIVGLDQAGYLTNETVFSLTELPRRLAVIGGGPIGCELAQAFARLGAEVHLLEVGRQILIREDPSAAQIVQQALARDGVKLLFGTAIHEVQPCRSEKRLVLEREGKTTSLTVDEILVGVGRAPNVQGLELEHAGVDYDPRSGVRVDDRLRTTNPRIFAAGDICSAYKFTHAADAMARIAVQNGLFFGRTKVSSLVIPWCTYTDPEIAHVGISARDAEKQGLAFTTFKVDMASVDRAVLDGETDGLLEVVAEKHGGRILGATLVARHAGDMISEVTLAMNRRASLGHLAKTIHPYPTQSAVFGRAGDAFNRTRLTPFILKLLTRIMAWRR